MRMAPAVSVITPCFNAAGTLPRTVASVRAQDFADWEMIISDDGSADDSADLADRLAALDPRIRVLRGPGPNTGAARARNRALAASRGRYIAFLDADDEWLPEKLSRQIGFMQAHGVAFSYTGFFREKGGIQRRVDVPPSVDHDELLRSCVIGCLTAIYDSAVLGRVPMPDLRFRQDYGTWLTLLKRTDRARAVQAPLAIYHERAGSLSSNKLRASIGTWRMYRQVAGLSPGRATACLASHLWRRLRH
jgi:teichuronic acid biosynthesis glycosyltransferase TuaG